MPFYLQMCNKKLLALSATNPILLGIRYTGRPVDISARMPAMAYGLSIL